MKHLNSWKKMPEPMLFSGMPVLLKSGSIEDSSDTDLHSLRTVKMAFDHYGEVRFGENGQVLPSDVLLALVQNGSEEEALRNAFRRHALTPPRILLSASPSDLPREIIDRLVELLRISTAREAGVMEALLLMREEAEEMREALRRVRESDAPGLPSQALTLVWDRAPFGESALLYFTGKFEFSARTSVETHGLAAIGLHVAGCRLQAGDRLDIRVLAEESGRVLGAWALPSVAVPANPEWLILDFPLPVSVARQTAMLVVGGSLSDESWLAFSQAADEAVALGDGNPTVAFRLYSGSAHRLSSSPWWNWEAAAAAPSRVEDFAAAVAIPGKSWLGARLIGPAAQLSSEGGSTRVRLAAGMGAMLVFPEVPLAGFSALVAQLEVLGGASAEVVTALTLLPADEALTDDLASAIAAALLWTPIQTMAPGISTLTLALTSSTPEVAHVGVALRHQGEHKEDFIVLSCDGLFLFSRGPRQSEAIGSVFLSQVGRAERETVFEDVELDETIMSNDYRHLDISIRGLEDGNTIWDRVKFKLFANGAEGGLEFRIGAGWPPIFRSWPGLEEDDFGQIHRIYGAEGLAKAIETLADEQDRELLGAISTLLPHIVQTLATNGAVADEMAEAWVEIARSLSAATSSMS